MMNQKETSFLNQIRAQKLLPLLWFLVSFLLALLGGFSLFSTATFEQVSSDIITTGLDLLRSQLIAALLLTAGAALLASLFTKRKLGALIGASFIFVLNYLIGFVQLELAPVFDPGGHLESLNANELVHTCTIMMALAILSAFIGAAVGAALYEALLEQPYALIHAIWRRLTTRVGTAQTTRRMTVQHSRYNWRPARWAAIPVMSALMLLASQSTNLFLISPDASLHNALQLAPIAGGVSSFGSIQTVEMQSALLGNRPHLFNIYLPPTYTTPIGKNKRYPVAYLLHGSPGRITDWIIAGKVTESADALISTHKTQELIIVLPDGNGRAGATSEWGNSADGTQMLEDYVADELVKYIDQHYRTITDADHRMIGGLSMGGFGAMNIAIHHPDVFHWVVSLGGYYKAIGSIWGTNQTYLQMNSPQLQIATNAAAQKLHIFLGDALEDKPYYQYTLNYAQELRRLHVNYTFIQEHGHHSWKVWTNQMYAALAWLNWGPIHEAPKSIRNS